MTDIIIPLLLTYFIINTFAFRFQRTTLSISRSILNVGKAEFQALLTPVWIGLLGWISQALWIIISILLFLQFGWIQALVFLLYVFMGTAFFDSITPLPSYNQCFNIIEKNLKKGVNKSKNLLQKIGLEEILEKIQTIKKEYKIKNK